MGANRHHAVWKAIGLVGALNRCFGVIAMCRKVAIRVQVLEAMCCNVCAIYVIAMLVWVLVPFVVIIMACR